MARRPSPKRVYTPFSESRNPATGTEPAPPGRLWVLLAIGILSLASVLGVVATGAPPQEETSTAQTDATVADAQVAIPSADPPGTIDGAKNPELIPDELALRMIVLAVAEPPDATEEQIERARVTLNPIGLSEEDTIALLTLLGDFRAEADPLDKQAAEVYVRAPIPHRDSTDYKQLVELGRQKNILADNAVAAFPARLREDGLRKLAAYLPEAKKGMKIIPPDPLIPK